MKFGRIKRQHGRIGGLDALLDRIVRDCPYVTRIVPGRIKVRRGKTPSSFKIQYPTNAGLKSSPEMPGVPLSTPHIYAQSYPHVRPRFHMVLYK